ncbi:MAG: imidazole glycerol phosphate synthase subunit HisH [Candidatus Diapherotrites archaeon]
MKMKTISIVDYGAGNLKSVQNAFGFLGMRTELISGARGIRKAEMLVFPGVGNFGEAMKRLRRKGIDSAIKQFIASGKPFLGICLGMQLLFEESEESAGVKGMGVFKGKVKRFPRGIVKVPQVGWNRLSAKGNSRLLNGAGGEMVYFINSYFAEPEDIGVVSAVSEYGGAFCSAVEEGDVFAVQFHPEKSGEAGLQILRNFAEMKP